MNGDCIEFDVYMLFRAQIIPNNGYVLFQRIQRYEQGRVYCHAVVTTQRAESGTCQVENAFLVALSIQMYQTSLSDLMVHAMYRFVL